MKKGQLKALFIEAKGTGQKYIGVMIQTEGSSEPEVIINPKENFNAKFDYYMAAYDDDLILIAAKGKRAVRETLRSMQIPPRLTMWTRRQIFPTWMSRSSKRLRMQSRKRVAS